MKFVLSRKGFDSERGGYPSPIMEDGRLISIPVPTHTPKQHRFADLRVTIGREATYFDLLSQLTGGGIRIDKKMQPLTRETRCHNDPDIRGTTLDREKGWKGCFGQAGIALRHLEELGIGSNDVFLFFGWFKNTAKENDDYAFSNTVHSKHVMFGYLQVDRKFHPHFEKEERWMKSHPHILHKGSDENNIIYIAPSTLTWNQNLPGWGIFDFDKELVLTKEGYSRSKWSLPPFFKELSITYHSKESWEEEYFQSAARGQEFVIQEDRRVTEWAQGLINRHAKRER